MNLRKRKLLIITSLLFVTCLFIFKSQNSKYDFEKKMHLENLSKSPFTKTKKLSKQERKKLELPPNAYNDELWELTMDPVLGRPRTENLFNGDDYQILFTASQKNRSLIKSIGKRMNQKFTIIGKINNGYKKNSINLDNKPLNLSNFKGYSHKF